jgi:hypothetical protein
MNSAAGEYGRCCAERLATGLAAPFHIDDVLGQPEKASPPITRIAILHKVTDL